MTDHSLLTACFLFSLVHIFVWLSTNLQFISPEVKSYSLMVSIFLAIPTTLCAYFASQNAYGILGDSAWGVRFLAFGISYLVFPIMTYLFLGESMFTIKTISCILLSFVIVYIQIFL
jgi:hypothetical protein